MTTVLLTRPQADSQRLAAQLEPLGFDCRIAPMLRIEANTPDRLPDATPQAVIISSRHAARLHDWSAIQHIPVIAVGHASAQAAQQAGFATIEQIPGSARHIVEAIQRERRPEDGPLLYLRGRDIALDIARMLPQFEVAECITYQAAPTGHLPEAVMQSLVQEAIDAVLFYSPRSAELFSQCLPPAQSLQAVAACCLSLRVAEQLKPAQWQEILTCARPDTPAMITLLQERFGTTN